MAYTSVIPVRRLDRTVDYVQNKAKTTPKSLEEAVDYAANRDKTESACFETGLGCTTTSAFEDMRLNTLRWHKETGVQGYHLVQSFAEGEVTPELAHQIGVEFAEQLLSTAPTAERRCPALCTQTATNWRMVVSAKKSSPSITAFSAANATKAAETVMGKHCTLPREWMPSS